MSESEERVEAVIVQLEAGSILLPRSALLEVTTRPGSSLEEDEVSAELPWLAAPLTWNELQIPVINVNHLLDPARDTGEDHRRFTRLLVLQGADEPDRLPYYALEVRGTPHPVRITPQNIFALEGVETTPWSWRVKASGVTTHLLRLDTIEARLRELPQGGPRERAAGSGTTADTPVG
ncbi:MULTISPECIES: hypothetical protein [unclassified Thioalkalivibrio]|uniref:hypothetical protein n=1 Tax=unclassified Thioalkalivibrio TaxID=2621013 RepID=UPI00037C67E7|nr:MULTISPECIES: hypothetical protein [unclassified Thioalkalivibrio]